MNRNRFFSSIATRRSSNMGSIEEFQKKYTLSGIVLGKGSYAEVKKGTRLRDGLEVAVKMIKKSEMQDKDITKLYNEVEMLKKLQHKNIVKYYESFDSDELLYVVMEYVEGGDLFEKIVSKDIAFNESAIRKILRSIIIGLKYCKENGVIHRDLKPDNILVTKSYNGEEDEFDIKIADFNLGKEIDPNMANFNVLETMLGTPNYVATEVLSGSPYNYKCDIWSCGVIAYLLLSGGYLPFWVNESLTPQEQQKQLLLKVKKGIWKFSPPEAFEFVSDEAKHFLKNTLQKDAEARFSYEQLLAHPFIALEEPEDLTQHENREIVMDRLQKMNIKRKILKALMVQDAVAIMAKFGGLLYDEDESSTFSMEEMMRRIDNNTNLQSGSTGFSFMLDE